LDESLRKALGLGGDAVGEAELDSLLARMPKIAAAVNEFKAEAIQQSVFNALLAAYGFKVAQAALSGATQEIEPLQGHEPDPVTMTAGEVSPNAKTRSSLKRKASSGGGAQTFKFLRELDLRPQGKKSFFDFVAEKAAASNEDRFAVTVYYLEEILELPAVTADHVGTSFRMVSEWREPADVKAALRVASSRKGTITSDPENLRITPHGRNFVEHELPQAPKAKASKS
jgi:hypothetical protein